MPSASPTTRQPRTPRWRISIASVLSKGETLMRPPRATRWRAARSDRARAARIRAARRHEHHRFVHGGRERDRREIRLVHDRLPRAEIEMPHRTHRLVANAGERRANFLRYILAIRGDVEPRRDESIGVEEERGML